MNCVLSYDVGTTGVKSCLFAIDDKVKMLGGEYCTYKLFILDNGGAEQDQTEWWDAIVQTTRGLLKRTGVSPEEIVGCRDSFWWIRTAKHFAAR